MNKYTVVFKATKVFLASDISTAEELAEQFLKESANALDMEVVQVTGSLQDNVR